MLTTVSSTSIEGEAGYFQIEVASLSLPGVTDVCYDLAVTNEAGQPVWAEAGLCGSRYGNAGNVTYVGSCDSTDSNGDGTARNSVTLTIASVMNNSTRLTDYIDPCAAPSSPGGCRLEAACIENGDTPITFNITLMREANQGFFDIGVNFEDIFCSAKLDCESRPGVPLDFLFNPATGLRDQTAVLGLACTAGPTAGRTVLLRDRIEVDCDGTLTVLDPTRAAGNAYGTGPTMFADPQPTDAIWQYANYVGAEELSCGASSCKKMFWNVAIGFDETVRDCTLFTRATAIDTSIHPSFKTPSNSVYPLIKYEVRLTSDTTPGTLACGRNPLNGDGSGVTTSYTKIDESLTFWGAFDGQGTAREARSAFVPAGTYLRGSPVTELGRAANESQHQVNLTRDFWMDRTEVTQAAWLELMGQNPSVNPAAANDYSNFAVNNISWFSALEYANRRSQRDGLATCYTLSGCTGDAASGTLAACSVAFAGLDCEGYRLPTEAEWERAARAGTTTATPVGNLVRAQCPDTTLSSVAWYCGNPAGPIGTRAVGLLQANSWGLYDMLGNLFEWTWDVYSATYPSSAVSDPTGPTSGSERVVRGGYWGSEPFAVRAAMRGNVPPSFQGDFMTLRLVRSMP